MNSEPCAAGSAFDFTATLARAWIRRSGANPSVVRHDVSALLTSLEPSFTLESPLKTIWDYSKRRFDRKLRVDLLVLLTALKGADSEPSECLQMLESIRTLAKSEQSNINNFHLEFETALSHRVGGDFHKAIRHWRLAKSATDVEFYQIQCELNISLALEHLGLSTDGVGLNALHYKKIDSMRKDPAAKSLVEQCDAYILRTLMRIGDLAALHAYAEERITIKEAVSRGKKPKKT